MATVTLIEYEDASPDVRAIYDDIMAVRKTDYVNNFWKALAHHPDTMRRLWNTLKEVMVAGEIDALTKEIQLCQDLQELFVKYTVPPDLVSCAGLGKVSSGAVRRCFIGVYAHSRRFEHEDILRH